MPKVPIINYPTNLAQKRKKRIQRVKDHAKDIDFRTRQQRSEEWRGEFNKWIDDLMLHQDSPYAQVQLPLLAEIQHGLETDPAETIRWMKEIKEESDAKRMLISSVLWLVEVPDK